MVNETIIERIEKFNEVAELKLQEELFGTEKEKQELKWESFSVAEIQKELSVTAEEAKLLMNCGIVPTKKVLRNAEKSSNRQLHTEIKRPSR